MSTPGSYRTPAPSYKVDIGYLAVFLGVLAVLVGVGYHTYSTTRVSVSEIEWPDPLSIGRTKTEKKLTEMAVGDIKGPVTVPTAAAEPTAQTIAAPVVAGAQATPVAPVKIEMVQPSVPPSSIPIAAIERAISAPVAQGQPQSAPPPQNAQPAVQTAGTKLKIVNTNGDGVYVRRSPKLADRLIAWQDNTIVEFLGETAEGDGTKWSKVKDPRGNVGWLPQQYLAAEGGQPQPAPGQPQPPAPAPAVAPAAPAPGAAAIRPPVPAPAVPGR